MLFLCECADNRVIPRPYSDNRVILALLLYFGLLLYIRLVMSTVSRPTSSSDQPYPPLGRPSSPLGHSSFSSSSSTTNSLSVGVAEVPPQVEVVRGDDSVSYTH